MNSYSPEKSSTFVTLSQHLILRSDKFKVVRFVLFRFFFIIEFTVLYQK